MTVEEVLNEIAGRMNASVSDVAVQLRPVVESMMEHSTVIEEPIQVKGEILRGMGPADGMIDLRGGTGGGGGGGGSMPGCYEISAKDEEKGLASGDFVNCHIICGGICVQGPTGNAWTFPNKIVAIRLTRDYRDNSLCGYDSFGDIKNDQVNNDVTVYPLYKIGDVTTSESGEVSGTVEIDYRNIPHFDTWAAIP